VIAGELDGVVLALAGLTRLGRADEIAQIFEVDELLPAPGQGALAVECRVDRADLADLLAVLDDQRTRAAVSAERAVLAALDAGCAAPVGAFAVCERDPHRPGVDTVRMTAVAMAIDGVRSVRKSIAGPSEAATNLGRDLAAEMIAEGAGTLIGEQKH